MNMNIKQLSLLTAILTLSAACANLHSVQTEKTLDGMVRITDLRTSTFFDSKSELTKFKALTTDKTQSLGIGGLNQEASSSNLVNVITAVAQGVAQGFIAQGLKPLP